MNLYDIQNDIDILLNQVDENGELPEETFALIEQLQITEGEKIDNIACYIKALKAESEAIANEIGILTERKRAKERKESSLREYLSCYLWSVGKTKVESARAVVSFRKSNKVEITNEDAIIKYASEHQDLGLTKIDIKTSKTAIASAIKSGAEVPGAVLVESQTLQVK